MLINVLDYNSPAQALANSLEGDSVYFPGYAPYVAPTGGWVIDRSLEIYGDGPGVLDGAAGTVLRAANASSPVFSVAPQSRNVFLHDCQLQRGGTGSGSGAGIVCTTTTATGLSDLRIKGLLVTGFPGDGVRLTGVNSGLGKVQRVSISDSIFRSCGGLGLSLSNVYDAHIAGCAFELNQKNGLAATGGTIGLFQCNFEQNASLSTWTAAANPNEGNLKLADCLMAKVDSCRFVDFQAGNVKKAIVVAGGVAVIGPCYFESADAQLCYGIFVTNAGTGPVAILSNRFKNTQKMISIASGVRDCVILPQFEDSSVGTIDLPSPNEGMFGGPHICRVGSNVYKGLVIPSSAALPTQGVVPGMLAYVTSTQAPLYPALVVRKAGGWEKVVVS